MKKSDLKTGMIIRTEHNRFGVIELEENRIDFCYDPDRLDEFKRFEKVSIDDLIEIDGQLGIGGYVTSELKKLFPDSLQEKEIGDPFWWYEIVAVYTLSKIYDNGVGIYPGIKVE